MALTKYLGIIDRSCLSAPFFLGLKKIIQLSLEGQKFDVVFVSYKPAAAIWLGLFARFLVSKHFVLEYRDLASQFSDKIVKEPWAFIDKSIESFILKFVSQVVVASPTQKYEFERAFKKQARVILNGVDSWNDKHSERSKNGTAYHNYLFGHSF